jgi:hypothetical protein
MQTTDNIIFDARLYRRASNWTVLLYEQNGVSIAINLPNANLLPFIRVCNKTIRCRNFIHRNPQKMVTLFAYDENMQHWLANGIDIPNNIQEIKIFCNSADQSFVNAWTRRHKQRFKNIMLEIINCDTLNYRLLLFGADHLKTLHSDFRPRSRSQKQSHRNYKNICRVLADYFWQEANSLYI